MAPEKTTDMLSQIPPWLRVVALIILAFVWAQQQFIPRAEWDLIQQQRSAQIEDLSERHASDKSDLEKKIEELAELVERHASQPYHQGTADAIRGIENKLGRIEERQEFSLEEMAKLRETVEDKSVGNSRR